MDNSLVARLVAALADRILVGRSPVFQEAMARLPRIAAGEAPVLIEGETGTGKELVARAVHYQGPRADFPFVAVNCGALPDTLLEDELFGHERGAFTDAHQRRPGLISQAEGGTLFLDEIDSLSRKAQVSLLRVLQEGCYRPVGSSTEQHANVRLLAATNSPLQPLVTAGAFRADLFYRLCVFRIQLPPLRLRKEDIPLLAEHFLDQHAPSQGPKPVLSEAAHAALLACEWPGNVRELENALIRGSQLCSDGRIEPEDLDLPRLGTTDSAVPGTLKAQKSAAVASFEMDYLRRVLATNQGNVTQAARTAGKDRRAFGKLLKKYRIDPACYRLPAPSSQFLART